MYFEMSCIHLWLAYRSSLSGKKIFFLFRDAIPEAPAVYFCLPTEDNIHRICQETTTYCTSVPVYPPSLIFLWIRIRPLGSLVILI